MRTHFEKKEYPQLYESIERKFKVYSHAASSLVEFSGLKKRNRDNLVIIDVGCGTGISTWEIYKFISSKDVIIGIDISKSMLKGSFTV